MILFCSEDFDLAPILTHPHIEPSRMYLFQILIVPTESQQIQTCRYDTFCAGMFRYIYEAWEDCNTLIWWKPGSRKCIKITRIHRSAVYNINVLLTHWGRMTRICVIKLSIIVADNGLSPDRHQAIIWTNAGWNIVNWTLRSILQWNIYRNSYILIQENLFQNAVCKKGRFVSASMC